MRTVTSAVAVFLISLFTTFAVQAKVDAGKGCISCHNGIESIREASSGMMVLIKSLGVPHGDSEGCVICHGGNPAATEAKAAHSNLDFTCFPTGKYGTYSPGNASRQFVARADILGTTR